MPSDILALEIGVHGWVMLWTLNGVLWSSSVVDKLGSSIQLSFSISLVDTSLKLILDSGSAVEQLVTLWIGYSDSSD